MRSLPTLRALPNAITWARLMLVPAVLILAWQGLPAMVVGLLAASFASDLLDGYLARRLNAVSAFGAKLDTLVDIGMYLAIGVAALRLWPALVVQEAPFFGAVVVSLVAPAAVALIKFRAPTSYHTLAVKAAALCAGGSLILLFAGGPAWPFQWSTPLCVIAALDEIAITLTLDRPRSDVRSFWHLQRVRRRARHTRQ
jgi:cardiolipin synthase